MSTTERSHQVDRENAHQESKHERHKSREEALTSGDFSQFYAKTREIVYHLKGYISELEDKQEQLLYVIGKGKRTNKARNQLYKEMADIRTDLRVGNRRNNERKEFEMQKRLKIQMKRISNLKQQVIERKADLKQQKKNIDDCCEYVAVLERRFNALWNDMHAVSKSKQEKKVDIVESQLYRVTTDCDTINWGNRKIKRQITTLMIQRNKHLRSVNAIKKKIATNKAKQKADAEIAKENYKERDNVLQDIEQLRKKEAREMEDLKDDKFHLHCAERQKELWRRFRLVKTKKRSYIEKPILREIRKVMDKIAQANKLQEEYKSVYKRLFEISGTKDLNKIGEAYIDIKNKIFDLFTRNSEAKQQVDALTKEVIQYISEINEMNKMKEMKVEANKQELVLYDDSVLSALRQVRAIVEQGEVKDENIDKLINLTDQAFQVSGCSNATVINLLGNQEGIQPRNLEECFKALEHHIYKLLHHKETLEVLKKEKLDGVKLKKPSINTILSGGLLGNKDMCEGTNARKPKLRFTKAMHMEDDDEGKGKTFWYEKPVTFAEMKEILQPKLDKYTKSEDKDSQNKGEKHEAQAYAKAVAEVKVKKEKKLTLNEIDSVKSVALKATSLEGNAPASSSSRSQSKSRSSYESKGAIDSKAKFHDGGGKVPKDSSAPPPISSATLSIKKQKGSVSQSARSSSSRKGSEANVHQPSKSTSKKVTIHPSAKPVGERKLPKDSSTPPPITKSAMSGTYRKARGSVSRGPSKSPHKDDGIKAPKPSLTTTPSTNTSVKKKSALLTSRKPTKSQVTSRKSSTSTTAKPDSAVKIPPETTTPVRFSSHPAVVIPPRELEGSEDPEDHEHGTDSVPDE